MREGEEERGGKESIKGLEEPTEERGGKRRGHETRKGSRIKMFVRSSLKSKSPFVAVPVTLQWCYSEVGIYNHNLVTDAHSVVLPRLASTRLPVTLLSVIGLHHCAAHSSQPSALLLYMMMHSISTDSTRY